MLWMDDESEGLKHALSVLQQARQAMPDCVMLAFAQADLEESSGQVDRARGIYEVRAVLLFLKITYIYFFNTLIRKV